MNILKIKTEKRKLGDFGEKAAAKYLKKNGYKILERNYAPIDHEIDIIASKENMIAFVEVKTRTIGNESSIEPRPASSVTREKQQSIIKAAKFYSSYNPSNKKKRFDIIEVYVNQKTNKYSVADIKHLEGTFNLNTAFDRH